MPNSSALASAGISRSFNFREVSSDSVRAVEVFKTGRADVPSGGIGATINIITGKPFDYDGFIPPLTSAPSTTPVLSRATISRRNSPA